EDDRPRRPRRREDDLLTETRVAPRQSTASAPADPLFDNPYEPDATVQPVAVPEPAVQARTGLSPNIRARRKVAALLGGKT
ncbi:MAG: ATP-dependent helicase, partial [Betaproteobacteria bacterium]|nr:ATP-dependent helicase [Betaproteobacteria bacterium]